jgi:hypothetical protein
MNKNIYENEFNSYNLSNIDLLINKKYWNEKDKKLDEETRNLCHIEAIEYYVLNLDHFCKKIKKPSNIIIID